MYSTGLDSPLLVLHHNRDSNSNSKILRTQSRQVFTVAGRDGTMLYRHRCSHHSVDGQELEKSHTAHARTPPPTACARAARPGHSAALSDAFTRAPPACAR